MEVVWERREELEGNGLIEHPPAPRPKISFSGSALGAAEFVLRFYQQILLTMLASIGESGPLDQLDGWLILSGPCRKRP